ncbi:MAG TPA: D-alanine--D-alanine ligase [Bacteroidota bacterium]|nr:D-alanine--D-alanine ligase [Bacteroidota bacterium]
MHVALVYNVKKSDGTAMGEGVQENGEDDRSVVVSPVKSKPTRDDTYAEWDTEETIQAVKTALEERHTVTLIEADEDAYQKLFAVQPEIVFNIAEGMRGPSREAQIPAILELLGIPYTGSDPLTLGICLDKSRAKEILSYYKIPTAPFAVVASLSELEKARTLLPAIVKPLYEGSSKGILNSSLVYTAQDLRREVKRVLTDYEEPALVEKFLSGREFTVALLGNGSSLQVFPVVELRLDKLPQGVNPVYSYEAKWVWDQSDHPIEMYDCPARIDAQLDARIKEICVQAYHVLRVRDWCRIDVRLDEQGNPNILELNPLPGILPNPDDHSCFPMAARAAGLNYNQMLNAVLEAAAARYGIH